MGEKIKIGIIICEQHCSRCTGIKCFRSLSNREGAFSTYKGKELELVSYTTCTGCPGGSLANKVLDEMKKVGVEVVFLSTAWVVGYPPCPHLNYLRDLIENVFGMKVVVGTHPIPQNFYERQNKLGTWDSKEWKELIKPTVADEKTRLAYD
jgi:predicted metal-binding protein